MKQNRLIILLLVLFSVLMSIPFLVPGMGAVALVALVPLLCAERIASYNGLRRFSGGTTPPLFFLTHLPRGGYARLLSAGAYLPLWPMPCSCPSYSQSSV